MMKIYRIKRIVLLFVITMLTIQCDKNFLDTQPQDIFSEEGVWNNADGARAFLFGTYYEANGLFNNIGGWVGLNGVSSGNRISSAYAFNDGWTPNMANWAAGNEIANEQIDQFTDMGWNRYDIIRRTNLIIKNVAESDGIVEVNRNEIIAEAKFLRGMVYYWLARRFGGVMIVDEPLTQDSDFKLPRSSEKETYDFIIQNFSEAATALAGKDLGKGRASEGAARAFIVDAALQAAAYTGDASYYDRVIAESNAISALGKYSLDDNYGLLFEDPSYASASSEVIFGEDNPSDVSNQLQTPVQNLIPNLSNDNKQASALPDLVDESFAGWIERHPTQQLVDDYLVIDTDGDGEAKKWDETSAFAAFTPGVDYISGFMWKNRDQRFYSSIVHDSSSYSNQTVALMRKDGNFERLARGGDWGVTISNYMFRKHVPDLVGNKAWDVPSPFFVIYQRLAKVRLNHAEALLQKSDIAGAVAIINETRMAHGGLPALSPSISMVDAWKFYKIERRVELLMENDYYWSLLRWGKYTGGEVIPELNEPLLGIEITADGKDYSFREIDNSNNSRKFSKKRYLFPVPEGERQQNENLSQNPDWNN